MSQKIQLRRGTNAARQTVVFDQGEPIWVTDTKKIYMGDGVTTGGYAINNNDGSVEILNNNISGTQINLSNERANNIFGSGAASGEWGAFKTVFLGTNAGMASVSGINSVFIGNNAGAYTSGQALSIHIGNNAGYQLTTKPELSYPQNIIMGNNAGYQSYNSVNSVLIGASAGIYATGVSRSVAVGSEASYNAYALEAVSVGFQALYTPDQCEQSVSIGTYAGAYTFGYRNTISIGHSAGLAAQSNNSVFIGHLVGASTINDNVLSIHNSEIQEANPLIYGKFDSKLLKINGNLLVTGFIAASGKPPTTMTSAGVSGQMAIGGSYLYVATGTNLWGRTLLSSW